MRISVLVAVWNNARYFRQALESALAQTRPAHEIIVVDDGSTDESAAIAESMSGVRVIRETHRGVAATRNTAMPLATGDYVAWLDSDDLWTPDKLAVQAGFMDANPEVGMTFTHQRLIFEEGVERPYWVTDAMLGGASPIVGTCSMMVRTSIQPAVGDFDATKSPADDTDWIIRAQERGFQRVMLPETLLVRRVHPHNLSTTMPLDKTRMLGLLRGALGRKRAQP